MMVLRPGIRLSLCVLAMMLSSSVAAGAQTAATWAGTAGTTAATDSDKVFILHKVPPFEATLKFPDPGFSNHRGQTALMDIDESLDFITSRFLFDFVFRYMEGMSRQHGRPLGQKLHSLQVQADLFEVDERGNILAGPNVDGRRIRHLRLGSARSSSNDESNTNRKRRQLSSFIPGAKPSSDAGQYEDLPPRYIVAEFTGMASFEDYRYDPADFDAIPGNEANNSEDDAVIDIDESTLRLMVGKALRQSYAYIQELRTSSDHLVASVLDAQLRMNLDTMLSDAGSSPGGNGSDDSSGKTDVPTFYYGGGEDSLPPAGNNPGPASMSAGGGASDVAVSSTEGKTSFPVPSGNEGMSSKEMATIGVMAVFLAFFVGFIYMYMAREYRHGGGHSGPSKKHGCDSDDAVMGAALHRNRDGSLQFRDDWNGNNAGVHGNNAGTEGPSNGSSQTYVDPQTGQVVYGAAFSPSDTQQVQAQYDAKRRDGQNKKKKSKRSLTLISPMMSIVEEEPPPPPPSRFGELPRSRNGHQLGVTDDNASPTPTSGGKVSALSQFSPSNLMQNVSSFFGSTTDGRESKPSQASPTGVENFIPPVPYKDFPRNDGTPCIIFSDHSDNSQWELSADSREAAEREALSAMSVEVGVSGVRESSNSSIQSTENKEPIISDQGIDTFVDKLEHLMVLKTRQYKERVKMEKERADRKKERGDKRRKGLTRSTSSSLKTTKSAPAANSNPQSPSIESPSSSKHGPIVESVLT